MSPRPVRAALALLLAGLPAAGMATNHALARTVHDSSFRPAAHCKGSTEAHVKIAWPTPAQRAMYRKLGWTKHVSFKVRRWAYLVVPAASAAGVDPLLVAAVIRVESSGDPLAWNLDSDAHGLMQVLHAPFQPAANIAEGVAMLASFERQFGNRDLALAAYNAGPGAIQTYGSLPPFHETRDYVVMVDYYHDSFAGMRLSRARVARFKSALADLIAYYRRICGKP